MLNKKLLIIISLLVLLAPLITMACVCPPPPPPPPPPESCGCTPGFWKQPQHFQYWMGGFDPDDIYPGTTMTLLEALQGGKATRESRVIVAGWLNAANPDAPCD